MGFYDRHILPRLTHMAMRQELLAPYRRRAVSGVEGRVLEIGVGSGLNLPLYSDRVERVIGIDPSAALLRTAAEALRSLETPVTLMEAVAESIPLEAGSIDSAVMTWTLCSVSDPARALGEIRRVLKPNGRLHFVEHGTAPERSVRRWQDGLTPVWRRCAGNCHLNRPVADLVEQSGFRMARLDTGYARGPRPIAFMYEGVALAN